ncbi:hypothetical protein IFM89_018820 [Coptis chinensis]|uniref:Uncharacterized protein n=1 Tax=Coptis chinensis TaxID=261450 RepID=A0A835LEP6_9MAGN|nr:hypothetical protein IFM89_018820 [Coptis chinensis]
MVRVIDLLSRLWAFSGGRGADRENAHGAKFGAWGALLGGCGIHGNIEVGELVGKHLVNIQPHHSGIESREISESDQSCELIQTAAHVDSGYLC